MIKTIKKKRGQIYLIQNHFMMKKVAFLVLVMESHQLNHNRV